MLTWRIADSYTHAEHKTWLAIDCKHKWYKVQCILASYPGRVGGERRSLGTRLSASLGCSVTSFTEISYPARWTGALTRQNTVSTILTWWVTNSCRDFNIKVYSEYKLNQVQQYFYLVHSDLPSTPWCNYTLQVLCNSPHSDTEGCIQLYICRQNSMQNCSDTEDIYHTHIMHPCQGYTKASYKTIHFIGKQVLVKTCTLFTHNVLMLRLHQKEYESMHQFTVYQVGHK